MGIGYQWGKLPLATAAVVARIWSNIVSGHQMYCMTISGSMEHNWPQLCNHGILSAAVATKMMMQHCNQVQHLEIVAINYIISSPYFERSNCGVV